MPMAASVTVTKGSHAKITSGYLNPGSAGDNVPEFIALETKTSSGTDGADFALVLPLDDEIVFEALSQDTPVQATHVGNSYDFNTAAQLDLDGTTDLVFHVLSIKSAADKIVVGRFVRSTLHT